MRGVRRRRHSYLMSSQELSPEYTRALKVLDTRLDALISNPSGEFTSDIMFDDAMQQIEMHCDRRISTKMFPSGDFWRWNQTKRRKDVFVNKRDVSVSIAKFTPRNSSRKASTQLPCLKLWHFELSFLRNLKCVYHILWCEKGFANRTPMMTQPDITMDDLQFLMPFMSVAAAREFWPSLSPRLNFQTDKLERQVFPELQPQQENFSACFAPSDTTNNDTPYAFLFK